jgi:hypothetical protein
MSNHRHPRKGANPPTLSPSATGAGSACAR